ncbi:DUF4349 domain-containing protein [Alicyclobacillus sp. SO9]|uniref:DUF4349 domain-containing protein n=1 Tax=Alicyclobacillus sp. SO9 TaxID=2665646 RepID=UPI0018E7C41E|nr:DUF4349 domain-containing protein [Alicyclobacillus sp. SO9]QQE78068.1 DUF4349 domain-containing protein [Alicyclobacillus sp. SO9]
MSVNRTNHSGLLTWLKRKWSPLSLVLILSALLAGAIVVGTLLQHTASSSQSSGHYKFASASSSSASGSATSSIRHTASNASANSIAQNATTTNSAAVIKTANLTVKSLHPDATASHVRNLLSKAGGYIQNMETNTGQKATSDNTIVNMTVRVPSGHFNSFLKEIKSTGAVENFSQSGRNVTQQANNLQLQLNQLQSEATAYSRLYSKAKTMKDMLQIQQSLTQVDSQINSVKQQVHHLHQSVSFGTVTIHLVSKTSAAVIEQKPMWHPLLQSLHFMKTSFFGLVTFLSWILPWGILFGIVLWLWTKWKHRQSGKNKSS